MKQIFKSKYSLRLVPLAMAGVFAFSAVVAQPANAQSAANTVRCAALTEFASKSATALKLGQDAMRGTFELTLSIKQAEWKLQDQAVAAVRQVSESAFIASIDAFARAPGLSQKQKAAIASYKDTLLKAVHILETNIDAAEAAYREDMLALIKAHQAALTVLVQQAVDKINAAAATARDNCEKTGVVVSLTATVASANAELLSKTIVLDAQSLAKAIQITMTRDKEFLKQGTQFIKTGTEVTAKLAMTILTGR